MKVKAGLYPHTDFAMPAVVTDLYSAQTKCFFVPLVYGTLRERGSKLRAPPRREVRATLTQMVRTLTK
ncbi:hypothetical protein IQ277_01770 [Nostocales cyanobacterium LEGE 12452]|nr:hypothetical protein [Nostocales cyanobacterium LEGE 12452]